MTYDHYGRPAGRPNRRSIRLQGYDYSRAGAYFITICTQDRACLFGEVVDGKMRLNECGNIVRHEWFRSAEIRHEIVLFPDEFVVMPNHIHGIVRIVQSHDADHRRGDRPVAPTKPPHGPEKHSVASLVAGFKSAVTKRINALRGTPGLPVWQRNYYEHIIRDEESLNRIRQYILDNPARWAFDRENPAVHPKPEEAWRA